MRAKVCVNCLGVAAEYDGVLDAASNDGLGKNMKFQRDVVEWRVQSARG